MKYCSPLRYPGGKGKVADFFKRVIDSNGLHGCVYVEPYVGGGSVALSLLFDGYASHIIVNDKDRSLYAFWYSVLHHANELCELINTTPVTMDAWYRQKEIQANKETAGLLDLGFSTFFLNRTNRSGIIKAGVIGGKEQRGKYKIDARYNKADLIDRIRRIENHADQITLYNNDAVELLTALNDQVPNNTLYYLDPPYYVKGQGLYMNYYGDSDHEKVYHAVAGLNKGHWIVTYDKVSFVCDLYSNYRQKDFILNYSAGKIGQGKEVMVFSNDLQIPEPIIFK